MKSKDFYWLLVDKIHAEEHTCTGVKSWNINIPSDKNSWKAIFIQVNWSELSRE